MTRWPIRASLSLAVAAITIRPKGIPPNVRINRVLKEKQSKFRDFEAHLPELDREKAKAPAQIFDQFINNFVQDQGARVGLELDFHFNLVLMLREVIRQRAKDATHACQGPQLALRPSVDHSAGSLQGAVLHG